MPSAVNDPHVESLVFEVTHGRSVAYRDDAPRIEHEEDAFRVVLENGTARFELKGHHATEEEALASVQPYIQSWELDADLRGRPGVFRLQFRRAVVIDRDPPPSTGGVINVAASGASFGFTTSNVRVTVVKSAYPAPPSGVTLKSDEPDVATMYHRLSGYYEGREPLPAMAYFCLTVLEGRFQGKGGARRRDAAAHYRIELDVLNAVGELASTKGGADSARKAEGSGSELSQREKRFLEGAVKQIIRRAAEVAQNPGRTLPTVTLADLPDLP